MFRIDNATAAAALPAVTAPGVNPDHYFTNGDPAVPLAATIVDAEWANMLQEELVAVIVSAGLALNKADRTQLRVAITAMISATPKVVTINPKVGIAYTTDLSDGNDILVTLSNAAAIALTIPSNAAVAYPIGTTIAFQQVGVGLVTMSGAGVTFHSRNGLKSGGQYAVWSITKKAVNTWAVVGDLAV